MNEEQKKRLKNNLLALLSTQAFYDFYKEDGAFTDFISGVHPQDSQERKSNEEEVNRTLEHFAEKLAYNMVTEE